MRETSQKWFYIVGHIGQGAILSLEIIFNDECLLPPHSTQPKGQKQTNQQQLPCLHPL